MQRPRARGTATPRGRKAMQTLGNLAKMVPRGYIRMGITTAS